MRKYIKKSIVSLMDDCFMIGNALKEMLSDTFFGVDFDFLCEFQGKIIQLGNRIEEENLDEEIVHRLEGICENIYQISQEENSQRMQLLYEGIFVNLEYVRRYILDIDEEPYKIAFFPYKVAMWDCLESIYRAAREDKDCECYVIPIPYYDKNEDGSFGQMHYEKDMFPSDVEVFDWEKFDYNKTTFDIAYIHNPYDKFNKVTSVHPQFYSDKLKKVTDELVYVPYFYTTGRLSAGHTFYPSYKNVDAIIVQNEESKAQIDKMLPVEKTYALGSPKLDRLIQADLKKQVPSQWREQIKDKKVVFLNASLTAILNSREKVLDKLEDLFKVAKSKMEIIILWRPHPLMEATLKAMEKNLYDRYISIKKDFIDNNIGIFDHGEDLEMVVALSDAYLGEQTSSIVGMFAALGKPIMFFDYNLDRECQEDVSAFFFDFYEQGDDIYFVNGEYPILCKANKTNEKIEAVKEFKVGISESIRTYSDVIMTDNKVFFTPVNANKVLSLDIKEDSIDEIPFPDVKNQNFNRGLLYNEKLYFVPLFAEYLLCVDTVTKQTECFYEPINALKRFSQEDGYACMFAACMVDCKIYMASTTSNCVVEFDVETKVTHCYRIGNENNTYWDMIYDGEAFWLNPHKGAAIIKWNKAEGTAEEFYRYPQGFKSLRPQEKRMYFLRLIDCDDYILAFPKYANMIVKIDKASGIMTHFELGLGYDEGDRLSPAYSWMSNYYFAKRCGGKVYAITAFDNSLLEIDIIQQTVRQHRFSFNKAMKNKLAKIVASSFIDDSEKHFMTELGYYTVEAYLDDISRNRLVKNGNRQSNFLKNINNSDGTCGEKVHKKMLEIF